MEMYDDNTGTDDKMSKEEIIKSERDILNDLLSLDLEADKPENYREIKIVRNKEVRLTFRIRPITEDESRLCMKRATPAARKQNMKPEANWVKYRSLLIYTATVDEDRKKIWDNREALQRMNLMEPWEIIDRVLYAGEKSRVIEVIDEISGYDQDLEEQAQD